jgi:hypothetical protein
VFVETCERAYQWTTSFSRSFIDKGEGEEMLELQGATAAPVPLEENAK